MFVFSGHSSGGMSYETNPGLLDCLSVYSYNTARDDSGGGGGGAATVEWWKVGGAKWAKFEYGRL